MSKQRTLVILKPEVLSNCLISNVLAFYEREKLKPIAMKLLRPSYEMMKEHYSDLVGRYSPETIEGILERMTKGNCIFMIFEGENIIKDIRQINGATDPRKAEIGTIRGTLAADINYNFVHGSDSVENAEREIKLWFPENSHHNV